MRTRKETIDRIAGKDFDVCVIGGGASGLACALEAQLRGLSTVVIEAGDYASGSSTASTKLAHGGVRYLQEAVNDLDINQYHLVEAAVKERALMLRNAPHLTRMVEFVVPCFSAFEKAYYGLGMKMYDWVAGKDSLFPSHLLSTSEALFRMPSLQGHNLAGAVTYADGQFDDARYAMALAESFVQAGGDGLNYARVSGLEKDAAGKLIGAHVTDQLARVDLSVRARAFINATGPFSDLMRQMATSGRAERMRPSKGVHILFPLDGFSPIDALLVPKTEDGRVIFAVPWNGRLLVGTTDTGYTPGEEMVATREEIDYLLRQLNPYLRSPLSADQMVSAYAGIRPLVTSTKVSETKKLIRDDEVEFDVSSGLISILGGKWTTHRLMGQETIDQVQEYLQLTVDPSPTLERGLAGSDAYDIDYWRTLVERFGVSAATAQHLSHKYGTLADEVLSLAKADPDLREPLTPGSAAIRAQVVFSVRHEMAVTIEDVLARRLGLQFYGWRLAIHAAPAVGALMRRELCWTPDEESKAVEAYVAQVNHMLTVAGQVPEPTNTGEKS
jgi:glycerol-3-phosphate dehydrogenase